MERREINIAHGERTERERERAVIRPGSGDVIVNYHPLIHLQHTPTHTQTQTHTPWTCDGEHRATFIITL